MGKFNGVAPPVVTPFGNNGELDTGRLIDNIKKLSNTGLSGFVVMGSNGEAAHLTSEEKSKLMDAAREAIPSDQWMIVGTGEQTTEATIALSKEAATRGADGVLVLSPFYYKGAMKPEVLKRHYLETADAVTVPTLIYNVPQFTGLNIEPGLVAELSEHQNIIGIKDSSGNIGQLTDICRLVPPDFDVFVGSAPVFYPAMAVGAVGGILAAANCLPEAFVEMQSLFRNKDFESLRRLQWDLMEISQAVTVKFGIGGLKAAMDIMGYKGGVVRRPLSMPGDDVQKHLETLLEPWKKYRK